VLTAKSGRQRPTVPLAERTFATVNLPDFREPLILEINLARQINVAAYAMLPHTSGRGRREDLATALAHIALEHVSAIFSLFEIGAIASGYALMRPALETAYKSIWIGSVANDTKVARAYIGRDVYGDLKDIINDIETKFEGTHWAVTFGKIRPFIRALHERTHSGGEQTVRRVNAQNMGTPEYAFGEIIRDIRTLAGAAILVAIPIATEENLGKLNTLMVANYSWLAGSAVV
jgi:hypothetical protein